MTLVEQAVAAHWPLRAVVADSFYGENETFRSGLQQLEVGYVLALKPSHGWWHPVEALGSLAEVAEAADWEGRERPGAWQAVTRFFCDGHDETWWALEGAAGPYGPQQPQRAVIVTTDPGQLPALTTWYLVTNLPVPGSEHAARSAQEPASLDEICGCMVYACGWSKATSKSSRHWGGQSTRCAATWPSGVTGHWCGVPSRSVGGIWGRNLGGTARMATGCGDVSQ